MVNGATENCSFGLPHDSSVLTVIDENIFYILRTDIPDIESQEHHLYNLLPRPTTTLDIFQRFIHRSASAHPATGFAQYAQFYHSSLGGAGHLTVPKASRAPWQVQTPPSHATHLHPNRDTLATVFFFGTWAGNQTSIDNWKNESMCRATFGVGGFC